MIRCMLVKWSGITASKSDMFLLGKKLQREKAESTGFWDWVVLGNGNLWKGHANSSKPLRLVEPSGLSPWCHFLIYLWDPLSMLIPLLPGLKTSNYIPLILNISNLFTSHRPSTSITLGVSSCQEHGSDIRLWRGSSSYNQGYGRVICALESNRKAGFLGDFLQHYPGVSQHLCFMLFFLVFPICDMRSWWNHTTATSTMTDPRKRNRLQETLKLVKGCRPCNWGPHGPSTVKLFLRIDTRCPPLMFANVDPINSFDIIYI